MFELHCQQLTECARIFCRIHRPTYAQSKISNVIFYLGESSFLCKKTMDFKELIEGWIVRALSTEIQPCKESDHFNITYGLYTDILGVIEEKGHNVEKTMTKILKMLHPHINLPSRISSLTRKVKRYYGDPHTTIHGTTPEVKDDYLGPSCRQAQLNQT